MSIFFSSLLHSLDFSAAADVRGHVDVAGQHFEIPWPATEDPPESVAESEDGEQ